MKKSILIISVITILTTVLFGQNQDIEAITKLGLAKYEKKEYNAALQEFEKALRIDKLNEKAIIGKVNTLIKLDKIKDAYEYADIGLTKSSDKSIFYYARGIVFNYKNQFKKAIEDFDQALETGKTNMVKKAYLSRGIAYQGLKEYEDAINDFTSYIETDGNNINALYYRGFTYYLLEDYNNAITDFEKVIQLDDNNAYAFYNLGMAYYRTSNLLNACKNFQAACQLNNTNACKMIITDCTKNR